MILSPAVQAFVCRDAVDMRRGVDGLLQLIGDAFAHSPFSGQVFVFIGRRRDRVKMIWWHSTGFVLLYKRLERGRFPAPESLASRGLSMAELMAFLEGIDLSCARRIRHVDASRVA